VAVPFANFQRAVEAIRSDLDIAVDRVLSRGWFLLGEEGSSFESEFAAWCGARHAVGVASGTDAIELALRALGIGHGAEVITQANTCVPTVAAIERAGATPMLCDIEPEAATMDPESLSNALNPRTAAIIPVHLYGQCAAMDAILAIASRQGIPVIEDCAQAHGAEFDGHPAGTMGLFGCFSFYPTKNLGALGDAGVVVTNDGGLAERLRLLRHYGQADRYRHVAPGVNSRMDELQAAILRVKLPRLDGWNARRNEIAAVYRKALDGTVARPLRLLPKGKHVFHLFVVDTPERERFQRSLHERDVATLIHYPLPIHRQEPYRYLGGAVPLAVSEQLSERVLSLPIFPELTDEEVATVAEAASEAARELA
jgi:dTDP-4-amino-4,6-dideoxygalactose transaminase